MRNVRPLTGREVELLECLGKYDRVMTSTEVKEQTFPHEKTYKLWDSFQTLVKAGFATKTIKQGAYAGATICKYQITKDGKEFLKA